MLAMSISNTQRYVLMFDDLRLSLEMNRFIELSWCQNIRSLQPYKEVRSLPPRSFLELDLFINFLSNQMEDADSLRKARLYPEAPDKHHRIGFLL